MSSIRLLQPLALFVLLTAPCFHSGAAAQSDTNSRNGGGTIWIAGSVISDSDEAPRIDLGSVHSILPGDTLAVFRSTNQHHIPITTVTIEETSNTWSRPRVSPAAPLKRGDRVFAIRILNQFGTPREFRQAFLERQLVATTNRNSYSTLRDSEVAMNLHELGRRQTLWLRQLRVNAGSLRGASIGSETYASLQPLLRQVRRLQDFSALGVPIETTIGKEWASVLATLTPQSALPQPPATPKKEGSKPATPEQPSPALAELERKITLIRQETDQLLFTNFPEERNVAVVLCTAIDIEGPKNEPLWISLELAKTQFPQLADDRDMLEEMPVILSRVRAKLNQ